MKKFEFQPDRIELTINGHPFSLFTTSQQAQKMKEVGLKTVDYGKSMQAAAAEGKPDEEILDQAVDFLYEGIDHILGEGASGKIFEGRARDFFDCMDVLRYINEEFGEARKSKLARYGKYSPDRAERKGAVK